LNTQHKISDIIINKVSYFLNKIISTNTSKTK